MDKIETHEELFADGKDREQCCVGHLDGQCIRCEFCHKFIKWPYDSVCEKKFRPDDDVGNNKKSN